MTFYVFSVASHFFSNTDTNANVRRGR